MDNKIFTCLTGALFLAVGVCSCTTDEAYNQLTEKNGIDLTITVAENGLTIPVGSTSQIFLTELLDTARTKTLKVSPDNQFYIEETGSLEASQLLVEPATFKADPKLEPKTFALEVTRNWSPMEQAAIDAITVSGTPMSEAFGEFTVKATRDDIALDDNSEKKIGFVFENYDTDPSIKYIKKIGISRPAAIGLSFEITDLPSPQQAYNIYMENIRLSLPDYFIITDSNGNPYSTDPTTGEYLLPSKIVYKEAGKNSVNWALDNTLIQGIDFGEGKIENDNGHVRLEGEIIFTAKMDIDNLEVSSSDLLIFVKQPGEEHNTVMLRQQVTISPTATVDEITINSVTGLFNPTIDKMHAEADLEFDDRLDFLTNENTVIDIKDIHMDVDLISECPLACMASVEMKGNNGKTAHVENIKVHQTTGDQPMHIVLNNNQNDPDNDIYLVDGLSTLVSPVPEHIDMDIDLKVVQEEVTYTLGKPNNFSARYSIKMPLAFNALNCTYDEVIEDVFDDDIKDLLSEVHGLTLGMNIVSALPVDGSVTVIGRGADGKNNPALINVSPAQVSKGSLSQPVDNKIALDLEIPRIADLKDIVIQLRMQGESFEFTPDQYIEVKDIKLTIKNQTIDLNDK